MCEHMEVKKAPRIKCAPWCQSIQEVEEEEIKKYISKISFPAYMPT